MQKGIKIALFSGMVIGCTVSQVALSQCANGSCQKRAQKTVKTPSILSKMYKMTAKSKTQKLPVKMEPAAANKALKL
jgi:hypothetical protein